ncbi:exonuclease 3'-5' domain-containing protein 2 [Melitaea cinxia]|uniref:exonuclease 3'-5' domain-containing protein 2 n=1 Tax=Melitaea cinxia TaxID=113334 RepID=UPI001E270C6F|nr:exonuclease 3'-5' domain-containing protein 2 [Melitaea cinxia]
MNTSSTLNIALTSAIALGFAGITYVVLRKSLKQKASHVAPDNLNINLITSEEDSEDAVNELRRRSARYHAIGFDCEWVSDQGKKHPVALLQLSTNDGYCALFRLSHLKSIPNCLKDLLEDGDIYKVGVSPGNDVKYLAKDYSVYTKSTLDIRHLAELCNYEPGGLGSLSKALLGIELDKSWRIRCSDWEAEELTERQITYAALDAHVALKIFVKLVNDYNKTPQFSPSRRNSTEHWNNISQFCSKYLDIGYKTKNKAKNDKECKEKKSKGTKEVVSKRYTHATRSKPLYHNCLLTAPDGELLSTCDDKKAKWYVENELADTVCAEPLTVRLRFEPAGRSVGAAGRYYQLSKENRCVVCGAGHSFIRKNVVPREYRKHFPEVMKEHSSHDVLLLCAACHQRSNARDQPVRERLAARCGAPLAPLAHARTSEDAACRNIRSAARALLHGSRKHVLPEARRRKLESVVLQHYLQHDEITTELLEEAANIQVAFENDDYESHGSKVVEHYRRHDGLLRLEQEWREHFLESMRPQHLPALWSVTHTAERLQVRQNEGRLSEDDLKLLAM